MVVPLACYRPLSFHCRECDKEHTTYDPTEILLLSEAAPMDVISEDFSEDDVLQSQRYKLSVTVEEAVVPTLFGLWVGELDFN